MAKTYEWYLQWCGKDDTPRTRAALVPCSTFNIWKDYNLKVVTYEEFSEMVTAHLIAKPESYWNVKPGQWALVIKSYCKQYERDLENLSNCFQDFLRGWDACEARVHMLMDWDEAIYHESVRNKWLKKAHHRYTFYRNEDESLSDWYRRGVVSTQLQLIRERDYMEEVVEKSDRRGKVWYLLHMHCTGPQFQEAVWDLARDFGWMFSFKDEIIDPTTEERKANQDPTYDREKRDAI